MEDYAVIVGVQHYKTNGLNTLPGATNDASDIYNWFISETGGNIPLENCKLLQSEEGLSTVLLSQIEDEITLMCDKATEENNGRRFYFFFSGHGLAVDSEEIALIPTDWREGLPRSMGADSWKKSILERGAFQEVLFFLDCCRSRKVNFKPSSNGLYNSSPDDRVSESNWLKAAAASYLDNAYEADLDGSDAVRKNGFFTQALLRGLKGEAANEEGVITFENLKTHLERITNEIAQKHNRRQIAQVSFNHNAADIFVKLHQNEFFKDDLMVVITFNSLEMAPYQIENSDFKLVDTYYGDQLTWNLTLPKGLYTLRNKNGDEMYFPVKNELNEIKNVNI